MTDRFVERCCNIPFLEGALCKISLSLPPPKSYLAAVALSSLTPIRRRRGPLLPSAGGEALFAAVSSSSSLDVVRPGWRGLGGGARGIGGAARRRQRDSSQRRRVASPLNLGRRAYMRIEGFRSRRRNEPLPCSPSMASSMTGPHRFALFPSLCRPYRPCEFVLKLSFLQFCVLLHESYEFHNLLAQIQGLRLFLFQKFD